MSVRTFETFWFDTKWHWNTHQPYKLIIKQNSITDSLINPGICTNNM